MHIHAHTCTHRHRVHTSIVTIHNLIYSPLKQITNKNVRRKKATQMFFSSLERSGINVL